MKELSFSNVKIHNEVELFCVSDMKTKKQLEHLFLENRISYFEKWEEITFIHRFFWGGERSRCTFCINEMQIDKVMEILQENPSLQEKVYMIRRRVEKTYF
ncbi:MAG: hypothetical protein K5739_01455 [Lachnospiraceae bacterium]|nr:hypothetical protein [Lachnospiraceae bacterium]